jgi:hypothetical protein
VVGVLLPLAETARRRTDFSNLPAYVDDFLAGGLLLAGAWAVTRGRSYGRGLLTGAWGVLCGGAYYSFFGQLARIDAPDPSGLPAPAVLAVKGVLWAVALGGLACAIRAFSRPPA